MSDLNIALGILIPIVPSIMIFILIIGYEIKQKRKESTNKCLKCGTEYSDTAVGFHPAQGFLCCHHEGEYMTVYQVKTDDYNTYVDKDFNSIITFLTEALGFNTDDYEACAVKIIKTEMLVFEYYNLSDWEA